VNLVWSHLALDRALEAKAYIAADNPQAAEEWARGLVRAVRRLKRHPRLGRVVPEIGLEEYREIIHGRHRVVYRISERTLHILTVRDAHQIMNLEELGGETR
jgi:toxin ParE1/3/4